MAITPEAQAALDRLTAAWGQPLSVTSGYRDPARNTRVGGARNSQHMHGNAFDISVAGMTPEQRLALATAARNAGFQGFGFYDNSLHFDVGAPRAWGPSYSRDSLPSWATDWVSQNIGGGAANSGGGVSVSTSGGRPMVGLLDMLQGQAQGQEPERQPFMERLALAANTLRMNPDQNLAAMLQQRQEQRAQAATANRTAQWLISQGREDLAQAMMSGAIDPKTAASVALQPPERQGRVVDAAALRQMFPNAEIAEGLYSMQPDGTISKVGGGGPSFNIDLSGGKFEETFAKGDADRLAAVEDVGLAAMRNISRINQLESLLQTAPQGMEGSLKLMAGEFGINTEGLDDAQAAQAMINSLVPEQRAPGTGPMSDADLALFKQSLPRIINQPGGNQTIISTMRAIAQYDAAGAQIVQELRDGRIDRAEAFRRLKSRPDPLAAVRNTLGSGGSTPAAPAPTGGATDVLMPEDYQYLGIGTP